MIKELTKLANHLDKKGLRKEADYLDKIIKSRAGLNLVEGTYTYYKSGDQATKGQLYAQKQRWIDPTGGGEAIHDTLTWDGNAWAKIDCSAGQCPASQQLVEKVEAMRITNNTEPGISWPTETQQQQQQPLDPNKMAKKRY